MTTVAKRNQQQLIFVIVHRLVFERCCIRQTLLGASYPNIMPNQKAATTTKTCGNGYVCSFEKVGPDTICLSSVGLSGSSLRSVRGICWPTALQQAQHSQLCREPFVPIPKRLHQIQKLLFARGQQVENERISHESSAR